MRFAQVTGILQSTDDGYRIVVTLDTKRSVETVRDEPVELLINRGMPDPEWTVDQLTQETIGTTLSEQGWEAVAHQPQPETEDWSPPTSSYLVRG